MGIGSIPDLVDAFHHGIGGGIKADGIIGAVEIVINGPGQADHGNGVLFGEDVGASEAAIAANHHKGVDVAFSQVFVGFTPTLGGTEVFGAG